MQGTLSIASNTSKSSSKAPRLQPAGAAAAAAAPAVEEGAAAAAPEQQQQQQQVSLEGLEIIRHRGHLRAWLQDKVALADAVQQQQQQRSRLEERKRKIGLD